MLSCKYCDYYEEIKTTEQGNEVSVCHFSNHIFMKDVETMDMEYPCKGMSYQDYLDSVDSLAAQATA
jgi:hypothetical protein